jgi:hypothetical protein
MPARESAPVKPIFRRNGILGPDPCALQPLWLARDLPGFCSSRSVWSFGPQMGGMYGSGTHKRGTKRLDTWLPRRFGAMTSMQIAAIRSLSSDTNTWTPGCARVSCQMLSARSRGCAIALTSDTSKSARREGRSEASAWRPIGIMGDLYRGWGPILATDNAVWKAETSGRYEDVLFRTSRTSGWPKRGTLTRSRRLG